MSHPHEDFEQRVNQKAEEVAPLYNSPPCDILGSYLDQIKEQLVKDAERRQQKLLDWLLSPASLPKPITGMKYTLDGKDIL